MTENPISLLTEDKLETLSSASALVVIGLQESLKDKYFPREDVFLGRDLISAYLEVHMGLDREVSMAAATNLLAHLVENGDLK